MLFMSDMFGPDERMKEFEFRLKLIDYKNFDSLIEFYRYCLSCARGGWAKPMDLFKYMFPSDYAFISSMLHKRVNTKKNIDFMMWLKPEAVYFGDLTYDNDYDVKVIPLKRKMAQRHLNKYFDAYMLFEEFGTQNTCRYHVHFVGVLKSGFKSKDVKESWPCFANCKFVHSSRGVASYLTNYTTKQVPRIRRNKQLVCLERQYHKVQYKSMEECERFSAEMSEMFDNLPF